MRVAKIVMTFFQFLFFPEIVLEVGFTASTTQMTLMVVVA